MSTSRPDALASALKACRRHVVTAGTFSLALNILHLAAPLYMLQVYDRVVSGGSGMTLAMLTIIVLVAYGALGGLDLARAQVLAAAGRRLDRHLAGLAFMAMLRRDAGDGGGRAGHSLRDLETCRQFIAGHAMAAVFDVPWLPLYLVIGLILHWSIGLFMLACAAVLIGVAMVSEARLRGHVQAAQQRAHVASTWAEASLRNAGAVRAMAMAPSVVGHWLGARSDAAAIQHEVTQRLASMSALVKFLRLAMQSLVLAIGAWLVINHAASAGVIFAGSLLLGRALQPVELLIGQWQTIVGARAAFGRLRDGLDLSAPALLRRVDGAEHGALVAENVSVCADRGGRVLLNNVSVKIDRGAAVAVVGPSGAGKSTLARVLAGALPPSTGRVSLGGRDIGQLLTGARRSPVGYLPQEVELFNDTVAANIGRFGQLSSRDVLDAARIAGAHDLIMRLPDGYHTRIGDGGIPLSGGMRQRIGLARAVAGGPLLVVLDEPSAHLDANGDHALAECLGHLQGRGTTIVMVSHKGASIALMRQYMVVIGGRLQAFGTRRDVVAQLAATAGSILTKAEQSGDVSARNVGTGG